MVIQYISRTSSCLCCVLGIFCITACGSSPKKVNTYRTPPQKTVVEKQARSVVSKRIPVVESVPQSQKKSQLDSTKEVTSSLSTAAILPSLTLVDDRIIAYEEKVKSWSEISLKASSVFRDEELQQEIMACRMQIESIMRGYNQLHETLLRESSGIGVDGSSAEKLVDIERQDMAFLESECQQILQTNKQGGGWLSGTQKRLVEEKESAIKDAMSQDDYALVISLFEQLSQDDKQDISINTIHLYSQALLKSGKPKEATSVLRDLLSRIRQDDFIKKEFDTLKLIADISFGVKDYNRSFRQYMDIINRYAGLGDYIEWSRQQQSVISSRGEKGTEVQSFSELLLAYLTYDPQKDGYAVTKLAGNFTDNYPNSDQYATAARIFIESRDKADTWFAGILKQIERYRTEEKYDEGISYIEQIPRVKLLPEKQEQLRALEDELISIQREEEETIRLAREQELESTWRSGLEYLRDKKYDKAIQFFSLLLETPYGEKAKMQIDEAAQLAAQENRTKAAELFVQAGRATERESKIELLSKSHELLNLILVKYPQSNLIGKVRKNISRIEEEISSIDPALLESIKKKEAGEADDESLSQPGNEENPGFVNEIDNIDRSLSVGRNDLKE